jgi:Domain of unknown function (DUF3291)
LDGWHDDGVNYLLAQVNIGRMLAPLDSVQLADFAAALDPVKAALWWIPAGHTPTTAEAEDGCCTYGSSGRRRTRSRCGSTPAAGRHGLPADAQPGRLDLSRLSRPAP